MDYLKIKLVERNVVAAINSDGSYYDLKNSLT